MPHGLQWPLAMDKTPPSNNQEANRARYTGDPGHYEVWYSTGSVPGKDIGWWIRTTLEHPLEGDPYAAQWFSVFDRKKNKRWGLCERFPITALKAIDDPFEVVLGTTGQAVRLTGGHYSGAIKAPQDKGHHGRWQFDWQPPAEPHLHLPGFAYTSSFASTVALAPTLDGCASGFLEIDGQRHDFENAPMYQTHLWGRKHAESWAWAHCNAFKDAPGVAFEGLCVRIRKWGMDWPPLTLIRLKTPEVDIVFRELWEAPFATSSFGPGFWRFEAVKGRYRVSGKFHAPMDLLLRADYEDPDHEASYCNNSCVASAWINVEERDGLGWRPLATYVADGTAHMENAARLPMTAVKEVIAQFGYGLDG